MQPIQDVVEHALKRNLTNIAALRLAQIGREVQMELFFRDLDWYLAHGGTLLEQVIVDRSLLHHAP
jgi:hypothetical protein